MILFFYNIALVMVLVASAPFWLWRMFTTEKYREGLGERLGRIRKGLVVTGRDGASEAAPVIWLHAVSVGEVLAVSRLVSELRSAFPAYRLLVSTTTRTGQALARERFGEDRVFYCPLDLPWAVRGYLNALRPKMLVLAETEFWPNLLTGCFRRGIPVVVVNARISDRSWPRYQMLKRLWKPVLGRISRALAQSETDAERLRALGCRPDRVSVGGNLKFDVRAAQEAEATRILKSLARGMRFLVAGSTLEGEEAAVVAAHRVLAEVETSLITVIAVRHPERFGAVAGLLAESGVPWVRRSEWKSKRESLAGGEIVLLDSIGELASVYSLAAVAFVGGSLVEAGGHNPLEPAQFGVPIVMGPHYANFRAITEDLRAHVGIRIVDREGFTEALRDLLTDREAAAAMGQRGKQVFEQQAGATGRAVDAIGEILGLDVRARMADAGQRV